MRKQVERTLRNIYEEFVGVGKATLTAASEANGPFDLKFVTKGPYLQFVCDMFAALGINASPEGVIRTRQRKRRTSN